VTTGDAPRVVELGATDRAGVIALWEACGLTRPWNPPDADFDRAVAGPTSAVLGVVSDGQVVATAMAGQDGHRGWVYYLAVAPDRRRSGLGRCLMTAAEQWLADAGVPKVQLMVRTSNEAVLAFYDRLGYEDQETVVLGRWLSEP